MKVRLSRQDVIGRFEDATFDQVRLVHLQEQEHSISGGKSRRRLKRRGDALD